MGPETSMHIGPVKMRMVECHNWSEFDTPTARAFQKLPWYKHVYCQNDIPSELRVVAQVMEDPRFSGK